MPLNRYEIASAKNIAHLLRKRLICGETIATLRLIVCRKFAKKVPPLIITFHHFPSFIHSVPRVRRLSAERWLSGSCSDPGRSLRVQQRVVYAVCPISVQSIRGDSSKGLNIKLQLISLIHSFQTIRFPEPGQILFESPASCSGRLVALVYGQLRGRISPLS